MLFALQMFVHLGGGNDPTTFAFFQGCCTTSLDDSPDLNHPVLMIICLLMSLHEIPGY